MNNLENLKVVELKQLLIDNNLKASGKKCELINRLKNHRSANLNKRFSKVDQNIMEVDNTFKCIVVAENKDYDNIEDNDDNDDNYYDFIFKIDECTYSDYSDDFESGEETYESHKCKTDERYYKNNQENVFRYDCDYNMDDQDTIYNFFPKNKFYFTKDNVSYTNGDAGII